MSKLQVNEIVDKEGTGSPTFTNGVVVSGVGTFSSQVSIAGTLTYEDVTNVDSVGVLTARVGAKILAGGLNAVGVVTATSFSGDGANLTNVGVDTSTVDASTLQVSGISTFKSDVRVTGNLNAGITTTSALVNATALSHRNLIINGAMQVAQRGTSSTSSGYYSVDRFLCQFGGTDEALTQSQHALGSSDTGPYEEGFVKSFHIQNGNQTSVGAADFVEIYTYLEDQDIASSGWNYKSSSSYITISFWVKSSVAQKFSGFFYTNNAGEGDSYMYSYQIDNGSGGNLTADTWTKITHSIPGSSSLSFNFDNTRGLAVGIFPFNGTDYTTSGHTDNAWAAWSSSNKLKDMTNTWYDTDNATFEITGVQLEVGPVATPFEHRSYGDELLLCQRYYQQIAGNTDNVCIGPGRSSGTTTGIFSVPLAVPLRASPTVNSIDWAFFTATNQTNLTATPTVDKWDAVSPVLTCYVSGLSGMTNARCLSAFSNSANTFTINSEL